MSDFWSKRLGQQAQQPAAPVAPAPTRPWWAVQQPPQPVQPYVPQPAQVTGIVPSADPQQLPQPSSVDPNGESSFSDLIHQDGYTTTKAQSARDTELCPESDSPNYMRPKGVPNALKQCFNCGFNARFAHSTAGASGIGQKNVAPPKPARVQQMNVSTFDPTRIVGRVG